MAENKNTQNEVAQEEKPMTDKELVDSFFDEIPEREPIIVGIAGEPGLGKTHFSNTFPNPVIADTEGRAHGVMKKFGGKRFRKVAKNMETIRQVISTMVQYMYKTPEERNNATFVLDSASDFQQMAESEYLKESKKEKVYPLMLWAKVYDKMDLVFDNLRKFGFNAVFTQQLKAEYEGEKATGNWIPAGYKKLPYRVDIWLQLQQGIEYNGNIYYPDVVVASVKKDWWHKKEETKPYLIDISYDGIYKELKPYKHPGDYDKAIQGILKELEKKTGIPIEKAKLTDKEA